MEFDFVDDRKAILLFGPSGAGKTTVGRILSQYDEFAVLHFGEILKTMAKAGELERRDTISINNGIPLSTDAISCALSRMLTSRTDDLGSKIFVIDGPPRNVQQAKLLTKTFNIEVVFHFQIPVEDLISRLHLRHISLGREDDSDELVLFKTSSFKKIERLLLVTLNVKKVVTIDAQRPPIENTANIISTLQAFGLQSSK